MSEEAHDVGERRRRREAERGAQAQGSDRSLTRRELRAREQGVETGALALDDTGEFRVLREPEVPSADEPPAITGSIGMTRRELRELRARQEAAAAQGAPSGSPASARPSNGSQSGAASATSAPSESSAPSATSAPSSGSAPSGPSPSAASPPTPTPARGTPEVRRPVVRPPASAGGVRSLAEDGTGLTPVVRGPHRDDAGGASPDAAGWGAESASIDATDSVAAVVAPAPAPAAAEPTAPTVADPGPLPTTRRARREPGEVLTETTAEPSLDAVIAGETEEPEPFNVRPAWAELPPPTPAGGVLPTATPSSTPAAPREQATEVMPPATAAAPSRTSGSTPSDDDHDEGEDDDGTPMWLTALMIVVLIVIGVVLGLLVYQLFLGDGAAGAAPATLLGERWNGMAGMQG